MKKFEVGKSYLEWYYGVETGIRYLCTKRTDYYIMFDVFDQKGNFSYGTKFRIPRKKAIGGITHDEYVERDGHFVASSETEEEAKQRKEKDFKKVAEMINNCEIVEHYEDIYKITRTLHSKPVFFELSFESQFDGEKLNEYYSFHSVRDEYEYKLLINNRAFQKEIPEFAELKTLSSFEIIELAECLDQVKEIR